MHTHAHSLPVYAYPCLNIYTHIHTHTPLLCAGGPLSPPTLYPPRPWHSTPDPEHSTSRRVWGSPIHLTLPQHSPVLGEIKAQRGQAQMGTLCTAHSLWAQKAMGRSLEEMQGCQCVCLSAPLDVGKEEKCCLCRCVLRGRCVPELVCRSRSVGVRCCLCSGRDAACTHLAVPVSPPAPATVGVTVSAAVPWAHVSTSVCGHL